MARSKMSPKQFMSFFILSVLVIGVFAFTLRINSDKTFDIRNKAATNPTNLIYWGAKIDGDVYLRTGDAPWDDTTWSTFETHTGKKASIIHWGFSYPTTFNYNLGVFQKVKSRGAINFVSFDTSTIKLSDIAYTTTYDAFFKTFAQQAAASKIPFFFRFDWEMDGGWFNWGTAIGNPKGNTTQHFKDMWIKLHNIFVANGATNVTWVWCPNSIYQKNPYPSLYPGDAYVDWTCFDTFNWSTLLGTAWKSAYDTYKPSYDALMALAPSKPIIVAETASSVQGAPVGTSKAAWISDLFTTQLPNNFPNIRGLIWFNWNNKQNNQTNDWPIELPTSLDAQNAFKSGIASSKYVAGQNYLTYLPPSPIKPPTQPVSATLTLSNANPPKGTKVNLRVQASSVAGNINYFEIYLRDYKYATNPTPLYNWSLIYSRNVYPTAPSLDLTYGQVTTPSTTCINTDGSNLLCNYLNGAYPGKYDLAIKVINSQNTGCGTSAIGLMEPVPDCGPVDMVTLTVQ